MRLVVVERQRVGDAAAREGQARLLGEERDLVGLAERQRLCWPPVRKPASNRRWHVLGRHRPIGDAALVGRHLDHRLEEIGAARAVAHDLGIDAAARRFRPRSPWRPCRRRAPVRRNRRECRCVGIMRAPPRRSRRAFRRRAGRSPRRRAWPTARRRTGRGNRPAPASPSRRLAVSWKPMPSNCLICAAMASEPIDWQASAWQSFSTCRPAGWLR